MLLSVNAFRFPFVNGGDEVKLLVLKLKLVTYGLAFLAHIMMSQGRSELFSLIG
jgi:hypothetical protein